MTNHKKTIGLVGAGLMGSGIATSLLRNGYPLCILQHEGNQPLAALLASGAVVCGTLSELAEKSDVIVLCVTGTPQVEAVLLADDGLLSSLKPGTLVIDCSTAIPASTLKIAEAVRLAGGRFLDAPMTRTPKEAAEGRLNLVVGGTQADFESGLPIMRAYAENIVHAGPVGAGHQMKLLHNYVSLGFTAVLAEAAACAQSAGTDPHTFCDILASGGGGGVVLERLRPFIENGDVGNFRFSMSNALKDMDYYCAMAGQQDSPRQLAQSVRELYEHAVQAGLAQAPVPQLVEHLADGQDENRSSYGTRKQSTH